VVPDGMVWTAVEAWKDASGELEKGLRSKSTYSTLVGHRGRTAPFGNTTVEFLLCSFLSQSSAEIATSALRPSGSSSDATRATSLRTPGWTTAQASHAVMHSRGRASRVVGLLRGSLLLTL